MVKLSPRLKAVASLIEKDLRIADIGTDHAYLPIYLIQNKISDYAIAVDVHEGPYKIAKKQVENYCLEAKIEVRLGDGLKPIQAGEIDGAIFAGMGSSTILSILAESEAVTASLEQLVLQPMVGVRNLREWLYAHDWVITKELLIEDDNIIYPILAAKKGHEAKPDWLTLELGKFILEERGPLFKKYVKKILNDMLKVQEGLMKSKKLETQDKLGLLELKINQLKNIL